jgi:hypothetical protein
MEKRRLAQQGPMVQAMAAPMRVELSAPVWA